MKALFSLPAACCSPWPVQRGLRTTTSFSKRTPVLKATIHSVASSSDAPSQKAQISGVIAPGWSDNSNWADVAVEYSKDTVNPHRGQTAQKIQIGRVSSGAVQFVQNVSFKKGRVHVWRVWLRGNPGTGVGLSLRKAGAPYTEFASQTASLSAECRSFVFSAPFRKTPRGF
jgi:hypothetical protein